jgi:hypothetical protein
VKILIIMEFVYVNFIILILQIFLLVMMNKKHVNQKDIIILI